MICSYDGYDYMGFQIQKDLPTIERKLVEAFRKLVGVPVKIYPAGRTDRYVHALGQVFHVDLDVSISEAGLKKGLNSFLPESIYIRSVEKVPMTFHARFSAVAKEYRYYINTGEYQPMLSRYMPTIVHLDAEALEEALKLLEGTHDFKGFASASIDTRKSTVKTIYHTQLIRREDLIEIRFVGDGFLKYQIRRMVGLLLEIALHKESKEKIIEVFEKKDPRISHRIADGCGLVLYRVEYEENR